MQEVIALVRFRGGQILVPLVIVHVVHHDVMEPVRVARDAEGWGDDDDVEAVDVFRQVKHDPFLNRRLWVE